jgi:mRNA-degrading endonuclease RelE of RelBE toxin-antitoxin system
MEYRLEIKEEARQQLRALPKEQRRNIGWRLDALQNDLAGDVKKLAAGTQEYRLRVGHFRVLFTLEANLISGLCCA